MREVLLQKLLLPQLTIKFPAFHATRRLPTVFTSHRRLSLPGATSIQSKLPTPPPPPKNPLCAEDTPKCLSDTLTHNTHSSHAPSSKSDVHFSLLTYFQRTFPKRMLFLIISNTSKFSWFETLAALWILYSFFFWWGGVTPGVWIQCADVSEHTVPGP